VLKNKNEIDAEMNRDSSIDEAKQRKNEKRFRKTYSKRRQLDPIEKMLKKIEKETDENFQKRKDEKERLKNVFVSTPAKSRKNIKGLEFLLSPIAPKEKSWSGDSTFYIPPLNPKKARGSKAKKPKRSDLQQGPKKRKTQQSIPVINVEEHVDRVPAISEKSPEIISESFLPIQNGLKTYSRRLKLRPVETSNSFSLLEVAEEPAREKVHENDDRKIDQVSTRKSTRRTSNRRSTKQPKSPDPLPNNEPSLPKQSLDLFDLMKNQEDGGRNPNPEPEKSSENTTESSNLVPLEVASRSNNPPRSLLKRKTESLTEIEDRITMRKSNRKRSKLSAMEEIVEESEVGVPAGAILKSFGGDIPVEPIKFITTRKPKKSVAIRICPDIMEISDSSLTSGGSRKSSLMPTSQINGLENQIKLHPGKWRKSLAAYKKSMACESQRGMLL
jgi:hypothetical protein